MERYTWDQIGLMGECIARNRIDMLEMVLGPVAEAMGGKRKPGRVSRGKERKPTTIDHTDLAAVKRAKARDARILVNAPQIQGVKIVWQEK